MTVLATPQVSISSRCLLTAGAISAQLAHVPKVALVAGNSGTTPPGNTDRVISQAFSITAGTPFTLNVVTAPDPLGNAAGMARVTHVLIENDSATTGQDLNIGGGTHPVLGSDHYTAQANGGAAAVVNPIPGYVVTGGSADTLTITAVAGTVSGKLTIFGASI